MLDGTPCTCGGNNENCFKCDGTGLCKPVPVRRSASERTFRSGGPRRQRPVNDAGYREDPTPMHSTTTGGFSKDSLQKCPNCGAVSKGLAGLRFHILAEHLYPALRAQRKLRESYSPQVIEANRRLIPSRLPMGASSPTKAKASSLKTPLKGERDTPCPECKKLFSGLSGLNDHKRVVHGLAVKPKTICKPTTLRRAPKSPAPTRVIQVRISAQEGVRPTYGSQGNSKPSRESSLDASRNYYDHYREHGNTLGSHPMHDDYGDEANA